MFTRPGSLEINSLAIPVSDLVSWSRSHDGSMVPVLLEKWCSMDPIKKYRQIMLAYIPAPWIRHGYWFVGSTFMTVAWRLTVASWNSWKSNCSLWISVLCGFSLHVPAFHDSWFLKIRWFKSPCVPDVCSLSGSMFLDILCVCLWHLHFPRCLMLLWLIF